MRTLYQIYLEKRIEDPDDLRFQLFQQGDVWAIDPKGFGNRGKKFGLVPWLVIQENGINKLSCQIVVATITDNTRKPIRKDTFTKVRIAPTEDNGLEKNSIVDCANICTVQKEYFQIFRGILTPQQTDKVKERLRNVLMLHK